MKDKIKVFIVILGLVSFLLYIFYSILPIEKKEFIPVSSHNERNYYL